jgi:hypothetical protein
MVGPNAWIAVYIMASARIVELAAGLMASAIQRPPSAVSKNAIPTASVTAWV